MRDEVALIVVKSVLPIVEVLGEIHLFCSPKGRLCLLVHLPYLLHLSATLASVLQGLSNAYLVVLNREEDKATLRFFEKRLVLLVEIDVADEAFAPLVDILRLGLCLSSDWGRGISEFLGEVEGLGVEAEGVNIVCHLRGGSLKEGRGSDGSRHGCYGPGCVLRGKSGWALRSSVGGEVVVRGRKTRVKIRTKYRSST